MEIWKDVAGYSGRYTVSNKGRVMNVKTGRVLRACKHRTGYFSVMLYADGVPHRFFLHRIVAKAFVKNDAGYEYVNHIDENKGNNTAGNLEWCTREHNMKHGTIRKRISEKRGNTQRKKRKVRQIDTDGTTIAVYESIASAARATGAARTSVYECCNNIHKSAKGYAWDYA